MPSVAFIVGKLQRQVIMDRFLKCKSKTPRDQEYVDAYLKTHSQIKAAETCGVSRETIARAVRRSGIPLTGRKYNGNPDAGRNQPQQKISNEQLKQEVQNLTCREIAIKYDISEERIYRRARKLGIKISCRFDGGRWYQRAMRYGCTEYDKTITLKKLIKRDKGICQLCGLPVDDKDIENGHAKGLYPSLDHIIPLSKGGTHTWDNVQLAHMACNSGKCDKYVISGEHGIKEEV